MPSLLLIKAKLVDMASWRYPVRRPSPQNHRQPILAGSAHGGGDEEPV